MTIRQTSIILLAAGAVLLTGCGKPKKKEISSLDRKQAETLVAEAEFALTVRDFPRAEGLLVKATALSPDRGQYWVSLGAARMRQGNRGGAKDAYKTALKAFEEACKEEKASPEAWLQRAYVLGLLGDPDEGRDVLSEAGKRFPNDADVQRFIQNKDYDRAVTDSKFKELAL